MKIIYANIDHKPNILAKCRAAPPASHTIYKRTKFLCLKPDINNENNDDGKRWATGVLWQLKVVVVVAAVVFRASIII